MNRIRPIAQSSAASPAVSRSLVDPRFEHDGCGVGFVARTSGRPSHDILQMALEAVRRLTHRGAVAADGKSGDGAGVLTQIPRRLFAREAERLGWRLDDGDLFGVGMLFLPEGDDTSEAALSAALQARGLRLLGWREVPVEADALGAVARAAAPDIRQVVVLPGRGMDGEQFERQLYLARKRFEREKTGGYVCSLSCRTVVYKALCAAHQLDRFYLDLRDPLFETAMALYHQRYSTNTLPSWPLAQPLRLLAHNGEINTLWGNRARMRARESQLPPEVRPVLDEEGSDSASLDEALELLARNGRDAVHGLAMLIVPAWEESAAGCSPELAAFYRYHLPTMEPWDGPAALTFADDRFVGAALDRNGLRPCRYKVTSDGLVMASSEVGVLDVDPEVVVEKGRLGPGQMLVVDLEEGRLLHDEEIKEQLSRRAPFAAWLGARPFWTDLSENGAGLSEEPDDLTDLHRLFGFTSEVLRLVLDPMVETAKQATWSMGDDTPIPPLARAPRSPYAFFRQRFAQVTNPAIDPLREASVMSLRTWLGPRPPLLSEGPQGILLELPTPVITAEQLERLGRQRDLRVALVECVFDPRPNALRAALDEVCGRAEAAVRDG
ncbi:MAG: glutamate synthase central domain-containing protein, partial [Myxococcota bacterium]